MSLELRGRVESVHAGGLLHLSKEEQESVFVHLDGFEGDKHRGFTRKADSRNRSYPRGTEMRNDRMWSGVSMEELRIIDQAMGIRGLAAATLGANICVSGIPRFSDLSKGSKLLFPHGAVLVVEGYNEPCTQAGEEIVRVHSGEHVKPNHFPKAAKSTRGVVGVVERPGNICKGDIVTVIVHDPERY